MNKILQVIKKDLKNRMSKRRFWMLSLMGPLIFSMMIIVPVGLNMKTASAKVIEVYQEPGVQLPIEELPKNEQINYMIARGDIDQLLAEFIESKHDIFVIIPQNYATTECLIYQKTNVSEKMKNQIKADLGTILKLKHLNQVFTKSEITQMNNAFLLKSIPLTSNNNNDAQFIIGLAAAVLIYYFTFSYSVQVMRNVMEEKTNRVIEVLLVAMKPWQLMTAKILGGSILGFIQFMIWVLLTLSILIPIYSHFELDRFSNQHIYETLQNIKDVDQAWEMNYFITSIQNINWNTIVPSIVMYFVLGYLLYSAMFAAIGAAVDQDAETQMFIMPVTAPLAVSIVFIQFVAQHPQHWWSKVLTFCPLTSPVITPIKIVTEQITGIELVLSVSILVISILTIIALASKIFKIGILNYGQTATWSELFKWIKA